jgi:hypothetical protein
MMLPVDRNNPTKSDSNYHTYHIGIDCLWYYWTCIQLVGKRFFMAGIQQNLSIFIGIAVAILMEKISFRKI